MVSAGCRFFCGPNAKKSAALAKQGKKRPRKGQGKTVESSDGGLPHSPLPSEGLTGPQILLNAPSRICGRTGHSPLVQYNSAPVPLGPE